MTRKQYRTAMGKTVDMGALMLQNENVRAVGNMNVNARGDKLDGANRVIDRKSQQIKRQNKKQVRSEQLPVTASNAAMKRAGADEMTADPTDTFADLPEEEIVETPAVEPETPVLQGGLAAAIAKAKTVEQTKLTPPKAAAKAAGLRKI